MTIKDEVEGYKVSFTTKDREILKAYFRLAEMVADLVGPHCEVVIHSLESLEKSVVKIVNGHHTGRKEGSPITDMGLKMLRLFLQTGEVNSKSYFTRNNKGEMLKSTTCVLAGDSNKPVGLFCVNMNLSAPFPDIIRTLMPDIASSSPISENFGSNVYDVVEQSADSIIKQVYDDKAINPKARNKSIVFQLFENGIFEFKEATAIISGKLGISKHAIYKYLREFKSDINEKE
ncbi:MAG: PAS domain-containing protein [Klebsiella huaxiensis]|uniref:helix-turn-helix transcriptional regulator n=1 Tax=Klebsiella huaxiensis TaxID=2153354 RepID=UPI0026F27F2D|nr:PAS domain-containing protein [Klebsiella huaxiensis]WEJ90379.1 MAG: PAS domain-containing protein [Klebsiella huaxiensis]